MSDIRAIWIIDDGIPANGIDDDTQPIGATVLKKQLDEKWADPSLRALVAKLLETPDQWLVWAARNPAFFLRALEDQGRRDVDVVIFDWDYSGEGHPKSVDRLYELLSNFFFLVYIHTGQDKITEVQGIIGTPKFAPYKNRLAIVAKGDGSAEKLIAAASGRYEENFSFRFGREIRGASAEALESILVKLGKHSYKDIAAIFKLDPTAGGEVELKELVANKILNLLLEDSELLKALTDKGLSLEDARTLMGVISDRLKDTLGGVQLGLAIKSASDDDVDEKHAEELWSYRLYYAPGDDVVRKGDIVRDAESKCFLVVSGDCDLPRFWNKNLGYINLVPLWDLDVKKADLLARMMKLKKGPLTSPGSLPEKIQGLPEGTAVLPFVPEDGVLRSFMAFGKELVSTEINPPPAAAGLGLKDFQNLAVTRPHWPVKRLCTLAEPYCSALIAKLIAAISSAGVADFPKPILTAINKKLSAITPPKAAPVVKPAPAAKTSPAATPAPPKAPPKAE